LNLALSDAENRARYDAWCDELFTTCPALHPLREKFRAGAHHLWRMGHGAGLAFAIWNSAVPTLGEPSDFAVMLRIAREDAAAGLEPFGLAAFERRVRLAVAEVAILPVCRQCRSATADLGPYCSEECRAAWWAECDRQDAAVSA